VTVPTGVAPARPRSWLPLTCVLAFLGALLATALTVSIRAIASGHFRVLMSVIIVVAIAGVLDVGIMAWRVLRPRATS
jgi:hypothetical protein